MIELKGNDNQKQKASQPCTHVHLCNKSVSARNGCYRISWWFRIWCSFPLKIRWGELKVTVKKCLRYAPDMDIHASHFSLLPVIPPYMALYLIWKHFPELKGEGCDFKYLYFWAGHLVCQFQMNWLHLHKLMIMRLWIISMNFTSNG